MTPGPLVCDACVVLNLVATGREVALLRAAGATVVMAPRARAEARYLRGPADEAGRPTLLPADLRPLEAEGLLAVRALEASDASVLVKYASLLKDSDAGCATLAETTGAPLATDDRKPRRGGSLEAE